jgi:hypothetical protein
MTEALRKFADNTAPVPRIFVVAPGAGQVQENAAETGSSKLSCHKNLQVFKVFWFFIEFIRFRDGYG